MADALLSARGKPPGASQKADECTSAESPLPRVFAAVFPALAKGDRRRGSAGGDLTGRPEMLTWYLFYR
jgi:hypothetical protein